MIKHHYGQRWLAKLGIAGLTIGNHIWYADDRPSQQIINHEVTHVYQYRRLAPLGIMPLGVFLYGLRWWSEFLLGIICYRSFGEAYRSISFEIEATHNE